MIADVAVPVAGEAAFYLMTDGISDQMGRGSEGGARRQIAALAEALAAYPGSEARRDDMTLVAFRLPSGSSAA